MGRTAESQTPHVAPGARRQLSLTSTPRTEDPFHTRRTNAAAFRIRGAFHRRIPSASLLACARHETCRAATGTLGFAAVAQLPTRVCKHCCQLDLRTVPAIRRSTHATCRPFDFYSCVELRAQPRTHRLRCSCRQPKWPAQRRRFPLRGRAGRVVIAQGSFGSASKGRTTPASTSVRQVRIYPNLFGPRHPYVACRCLPRSGKRSGLRLNGAPRGPLSMPSGIRSLLTNAVAFAVYGESTRRADRAEAWLAL